MRRTGGDQDDARRNIEDDDGRVERRYDGTNLQQNEL
jgi:hypothetical protein